MGQGAGPLDVVGGAGGDVAQHQALRHPAAEKGGDLILQIALGEVGAVLLRQGDGHAAGLAPGNDGDLAHGVVVGQAVHHDGMARLVIGRQLPLVLGDDAAVLLGPGDDLDLRRPDILHAEVRGVLPGGQQGRLVEEVLQVRAGEARGAPGDVRQVHILGQGLVLGVDLQDLLPAPDVRQAHVDLPVEAAGAQQGGVQDIRPVGGRQDHHALVAAEAVHLHQELV